MDKRLTRNEMLFSLGFLFMLVCAVGAFFYGVQIGSDKTEAKYIEQTKHLSGSTGQTVAYQQQDLVSFYHTVFLPYREFQAEWFLTMDKLSSMQLTEPASAMKELTSLAKQKYSDVEHASVAKSSPLLIQSQVEFLKGLKLLSDATEHVASSAKNLSNADLLKSLLTDVYYKEGIVQVTSAQLDYYSSMLKWSGSINSDIPSEYESPSILGIAQWKSLPLVVKNKLMAEQLKARKLLTPYYPQDVTARVDEFILSGEASKMKMETVDAIVDLLINTKAVRSGDFTYSKARFYSKELLPQLPFFFPEES